MTESTPFKEVRKELSDEQIDFICKEVGVEKEKFLSMTEDELDGVYDKLCDIEIDEIMECRDSELSERGTMASDLVTLFGNSIAEDDESSPE